MSIRTKLVSAIALLVATILAISAFSYMAMQRGSQTAETIVSDRVIPLEQLKSIADAYAVNIVDTVHKLRAGAITSTEAADHVREATRIIDENWSAFMATYLTPEEAALADEFAVMRKAADAEIGEIQRLVANGNAEAVARYADTRLYATIDPLGAPIGKLVDLQIRVAKDELAKAHALTTVLTYVMAAMFAIGAAIAAFSIVTVISGVVRPLDALSRAMNAIAGGDLDAAVYGEGRRDEVGRMAGAVAVLRDNGRERVRLEAEAAANRSQSEQARIDRERQQAQEAAEIKQAIDGLAAGLDALADGRLTYRLGTAVADRLDRIRLDFNGAMAQLEDAMRAVGVNGRGIAAGSNEIKAAADDLSRRTEQQAASVEETAAALEQITTTVADASRRAEEAGRLVDQTRVNAEHSGDVVARAVTAMQQISSSSGEINSIIGVIDEIAFQTNLLALNAGVEAARAGEAGKGFAVVAQEVRELAGRSAKAAKEIKDLIGASGDHVRAGVDLVEETGRVLARIVAQVKEIDGNVAAIVTSAREQATGIGEINHAVSLMDQGVQQNAAMVEQSTAASHSLAREADALFSLLARFEVGGDAAPVERNAVAVSAPLPKANVARRGIAPVPASRGNAALKADDWEEF